jgi:ketopantoate reductase
VVLIGRPQLVEAVERQGLRLETQTFDEHVRVSASTEGSAVQGAQLVLFCVKSTDTESGAAAIKPHLALDAVVLSLQNGGGFKIPWRDDRRSASRVVSVIQTTSMRLDYEIRSTVAGHRLQLSNLFNWSYEHAAGRRSGKCSRRNGRSSFPMRAGSSRRHCPS